MEPGPDAPVWRHLVLHDGLCRNCCQVFLVKTSLCSYILLDAVTAVIHLLQSVDIARLVSTLTGKFSMNIHTVLKQIGTVFYAGTSS